jgi:NodT family efflux transporter outer membrane factor (OMF) lipoprotein
MRLKHFATAAIAMTAGCTVGPDYSPPKPLAAPDAALTQVSDNALVSGETLPDKWWKLFDDPVLDGLVERALSKNNDLRVARANLKASRAALAGTRASKLPSADVSASAVQQKQAGIASVPFLEDDFYSASFDASYEIDIFGGRRRSIEAAEADYLSTKAAMEVARVSVAAETARTYAAACAFGNQAQTARETVMLLERRLDLTQRLLQGGRGTQRDVDDVTLLVEQAKAQIPQFDAERRAALFALSVLTGDPPAQSVGPDYAPAQCTTPPDIKQKIPVGDGQALLARRPDIRQAERILAADVARIGVATAALYPKISILGSVSLGASDIGNLPKSNSLGFSIGPFLSWSLPLNGAARAQVKANEAIAEGSLARFDQAVLLALQETEQALARLNGAVEREAALLRGYKASESSARISRVRYEYGADSFLQLTEAERNRAAAQSAYASAQAERAAAQIALFKALGGGWQEQQ